MPLAHLIFFGEPRELTDEQYEEARALGHLRAEAPEAGAAAGPMTASGTGTVISGDDTAGTSGDDDHTDEQGA